MTTLSKKLGLSVFAIALMLLGMTLLPVSAAYIPAETETLEQSFVADENGHTYLYADEPTTFYENSYLTHDEGLTVDKYTYNLDGWNSPQSTYPGPAKRSYSFHEGSGIQAGWLDTYSRLPTFYDFANKSSDPLTVGAVTERNVFPIELSVQSSIVIESDEIYYGTFNLTDEEFMHITFGARQDTSECMMLVLDPTGRLLTEGYVNGGDIQIVPFKPTIAGMYTIFLTCFTFRENLCIVDLRLDPVTTTDLPIGGIAEGLLNGSEYIINQNDGALIHEEKAPSAITYRISSNWTTPARLRYSFNIPELTGDIYDIYEPWIFISSESYTDDGIEVGFVDFAGPGGGPFYYQSFQNESYYLTVIGMDNVGYTLFHDQPFFDELPVNQEFYIENGGADYETQIFTLQLSQDSVIRVNSSENPSDGYDWDLWTVRDNMLYQSRSIQDYSAFEDAQIYYIPAGEYLVSAECEDDEAWGFYEFNVGPVIDGIGQIAVDNGALVGVRFDTSVLSWYNISVSLNTHDNVTADVDIQTFNTYGGRLTSMDENLGNRQSGVGWVEYPANYTTWITNGFCDGFGIVVVSPYDVQNNTAGLPGNSFGDYTLDFTVSVEDGIPWTFNDTASISMDDAWYNFTLGDLGDVEEAYLLTLNCTAGTWMNVSVYVEDVLDWDCKVFQAIDGKLHYINWNDLNDAFVGSYTDESAFQVGSISDTLLFVFEIDRQQSGEGRLDIEIVPFQMNTFEYMPPVIYQGVVVPPGVDMGTVAIVAGVGIVAVVVVGIVIITKKKPELLGRFKK